MYLLCQWHITGALPEQLYYRLPILSDLVFYDHGPLMLSFCVWSIFLSSYFMLLIAALNNRVKSRVMKIHIECIKRPCHQYKALPCFTKIKNVPLYGRTLYYLPIKLFSRNSFIRSGFLLFFP